MDVRSKCRKLPPDGRPSTSWQVGQTRVHFRNASWKRSSAPGGECAVQERRSTPLRNGTSFVLHVVPCIAVSFTERESMRFRFTNCGFVDRKFVVVAKMRRGAGALGSAAILTNCMIMETGTAGA